MRMSSIDKLQAENAALRDSAERNRAVIEQAADALFIHDLDGRILDVNRRACQSLGYAREELLRLSVSDIEMHFHAEKVERIWRKLRQGKYVTIRGAHRRKDGAEFPVEVRVSVCESGAEKTVLVMARDISEQMRAETALRESEARFRGLVAHASEGIFTHGLDGRFSEANPAACAMLGYSRDELLRMHPWDFVVNDPKEKMLGLWNGMATGEAIAVDGVFRRKDGSDVFAEVRLVRFEQDGEPAIIATCRDVTERQLAEHAVAEERKRIARDMHDTLAQGFTGVIVQLEAAEDALVRRRASEATGHIHRAGEVARASLAEARRAMRALRPEALEHGTLCAALLRLCERTTATAAMRAEFRTSGDRRELSAEREENLLRIAQEALINAAKHSAATKFEILFEYGRDSLEVRLRDNGRGFDPAAQHEGLGLVGMTERAHRIAASLTTHSTPGGGTEILVTLPFARFP